MTLLLFKRHTPDYNRRATAYTELWCRLYKSKGPPQPLVFVCVRGNLLCSRRAAEHFQAIAPRPRPSMESVKFLHADVLCISHPHCQGCCVPHCGGMMAETHTSTTTYVFCRTHTLPSEVHFEPHSSLYFTIYY